MWKKKFWYRVIIVTMYFNAGIIPWYLTMLNLGLTNNFLGYILPVIVSPFYIILSKTYIESLGTEVREAAEVDGAGTLTVFWRIIMPVSKPILSTVAIFAAVGQWNAFQDTLLLMTQERLFTLQFILYRYLQSSNSLKNILNVSGGGAAAIAAQAQTQTSIRMTVTIIVALPILLVYPFFQRFFVKGIMIGAVKG
jgi:ABC-type glycerol-3-phosphate transport system permease component